MRITRLKLENWKNFQSIDIPLRARAFFLGPNASGKSNLLDALRFLRDVAATQGGGLQSAAARRGGVRALRCLAARRTPDIALEVEIGDDDGAQWRYGLAFKHGKDDRPVITRESVTQFCGVEEKVVLARPDDGDAADPERLSETHLEQISANRDFREIAEFLRSVSYLHAVPQIIRAPGRFQPEPDDPFGGRLLARIGETAKKTRDARLKRMNDALRIAVPQLDELQLDIDSDGVPHLKAKYRHWRPNGAWQREDQFSDGTLRLLGLVWALMEKGGPLLLEEPELSLHSAVVEKLAAVIRAATRRGGRQSLITTHSADLLSDPGIGLDEVFVLTPGDNGTTILQPGQRADIRAMMEQGISLPEALLPLSRPPKPEELPLFARDWN